MAHSQGTHRAWLQAGGRGTDSGYLGLRLAKPQGAKRAFSFLPYSFTVLYIMHHNIYLFDVDKGRAFNKFWVV